MVDYDLMCVADLKRVLAEAPVAYLPIGCPEMHGEHLTFGLDAIKAHELCRRMAERGGGAVQPPLHAGTSATTSFNFGNIYISQAVARALYTEYLVGLARVGFRVIIALTGHYPGAQVAVVKHAAADAMAMTGAWTVGLDECELAFDHDYLGDHAGKWETSLYMHLRPDLVHMDHLPDDPDAKLIAAGPEDPRVHASAELGETVSGAIVERMAEFVGMLLEMDSDPVQHGPTKTQMRVATRAMALAHERGDMSPRRDERYQAACADFYAGEFGLATGLVTSAYGIGPGELG